MAERNPLSIVSTLEVLIDEKKYTTIRDILITGGDALMSRNESLRKILKAVIDMAERKRKAGTLWQM